MERKHKGMAGGGFSFREGRDEESEDFLAFLFEDKLPKKEEALPVDADPDSDVGFAL